MAKVKEAYSGKLFVRQYSDAELRDTVLVTDDPHSLGSLAENPPARDQDMEFVAQYRSGEVVVCSFGHKHQKGFVLKDGSGLHYLIGKDCAAEHYGLNWEAFAKSVSKSVERQSNLRWLDDISRRMIEARADIEAVITSPSVSAFDELRRQVQHLPPAVLSSFRNASGYRDTWMTATYLVRDHRAERLMKEKAYEEYEASVQQRWPSSERNRLKREMVESQSRKIWEETTKSILRCPAPTLFRSNFKMAPRLQAIANNLHSQAITLLGTLRVPQPSVAARSMAEAAKSFDAVLAEIEAAALMFSPGVLDLLTALFEGEEFKGITTRRLSYGISFSMAQGEEFALRLPRGLLPLGFSLCERLRFDERRFQD
ncbi:MULTISPECIES: hypothetical protein [unclassified Ensifer]|uniref:hypothetical protein n=1 Tax=unclassified Ensifer TaxID=2633371 RepID=UPI000813B541|nr:MULTISPECIES: hypothetical protein [unclassified Ensifer]OCP19679.1 hypothetical protein BC361_30205 [Ensifer sp. LC54]OCP19710.1 hypothetical protein BC363_30510 [Ensifer sp. LC384]